MSDGPWLVISVPEFLRALVEVETGAEPNEVVSRVVSEVEAKEDYREAEGFHEDERLSDPFETNNPYQLLRVIEIQRNALEFLMRELMEKNGEDTIDVAQRVDFLLSQPLG